MSTHDNFKKRVAKRKNEFDVNKKDMLGTPGTAPPKKDKPNPTLKPQPPKKPKL